MARGGDKGGKPAGGRARKTREKGGERSFITSVEDMALREKMEEMKVKARKARRTDGEEGGDDDDDSEDDDDDDESDEEEEGDANAGVTFERVQTKSLFGFSQSALGPTIEPGKKKASGVGAIVKTQNPNRMASQTKLVKAKNVGAAAADGAAKPELTRREREALEKEAAAARYMKKHLAGETDEAKKDLARLAEVKRRREEAEKRKAEEEAAAAEREKAKKKTEEKANDDEILDARAIKALKPNVLKDKLKERGLSTQGQKKDLIQRLIDYEDERAL